MDGVTFFFVVVIYSQCMADKSVKTEKTKLTPKQRKFCDEYLVDRNATQAAIRAGYSAKTAYAIGKENLHKPLIRENINSRIEKQSEKTQITVETILRRLDNLARTAEKTSDQLKANELLGKHLQMFSERLDVKHSGDIQLHIVRFSRSDRDDT